MNNDYSFSSERFLSKAKTIQNNCDAIRLFLFWSRSLTYPKLDYSQLMEEDEQDAHRTDKPHDKEEEGDKTRGERAAVRQL